MRIFLLQWVLGQITGRMVWEKLVLHSLAAAASCFPKAEATWPLLRPPVEGFIGTCRHYQKGCPLGGGHGGSGVPRAHELLWSLCHCCWWHCLGSWQGVAEL